MSEKTSVLLSDVTIKGNVIEKEKLMTDAKIEGDVSAEVLQTFEGSNIKGDINSSNPSVGGTLQGKAPILLHITLTPLSNKSIFKFGSTFAYCFYCSSFYTSSCSIINF